jgi:hypothetical protein
MTILSKSHITIRLELHLVCTCNFLSPLLLHLSLPISLLLLADRDCRLPINLEDPVPILDLQACIC